MAARGDPRLDPGIDVGFEAANGPSAEVDLFREFPSLSAFVDGASAKSRPFGDGGEAQHGAVGMMIGLLHVRWLQGNLVGHQVRRAREYVTESTSGGRHPMPGPRKLRVLDCQ